MKELIYKSYKMGYDACPDKSSAPGQNKDFIQILPYCTVDDDETIMLRMTMYKAYINGWSQAHLDKMWNVD